MPFEEKEIDELAQIMGQNKDIIRVGGIFHPHAYRRVLDIVRNKTRFVHYTSVSAAIAIFESNEIWMRKAACMNDFSEVQHGLNCLYSAYRDAECGGRFKKIMEALQPGLSSDIEKIFDGWTPHFFADTYLTCLSEHDPSEDYIGRLSMWRAYGSDTGVALVLNTTPFQTGRGQLGAVTSPVAYLRPEEFKQEFSGLVNNIEQNMETIKALNRETLKAFVFNAFRLAAISTKHPGFREEREWRVIYSPAILLSKHMKKEIQIVGGVPQPVQKIPLQDIPDEGLTGIEIPALLDRLIIGPTQYPLAVREAFVDILEKAKVANPANKVFVSDIPLRR